MLLHWQLHLLTTSAADAVPRYCSKALVSAICASGCFLSNRETLKQDRNEDQNLVRGFYNEALEDLNSRKETTVPDTAAMYLVSHVEGYWGNESSQWIFGGRSALMALDLNLHLGPNSGREPPEGQFSQEGQDEFQSRMQSFWGCFHVSQ